MIVHQSCAACGSKKWIKALDLGVMPNANEFVYEEKLNALRNYRIEYYWCNNCGLFQQIELVNSQVLFGKNYTYQTGINFPTVEHFKKMTKNLLKNRNSFVVIIGSNDGTEIKLFEEAGAKIVVGIEPAKNIATMAKRRGLKTINAFFTESLSKKIVKEFGKADLIVANNVFAHVPNPKDMLTGMKNLIKKEGSIVIEVQWFRDVLKKLSIDTLYVEHYYEWTVRAMKKLSAEVGLKLVNATHLPSQQGGSIRFVLKRTGKISKNVGKLLYMENKDGVYNLSNILNLQQRAEKRKTKLIKTLKKLKSNGSRIVIWAVPAKVSTILNFCNITSELVDLAYDSTPTKIGRCIPMAGIKIEDEKYLNPNMKNMPDFIIIGAWNYLDFAKNKLKWFTEKGGRLINLLNSGLI